MKRWRSRHRWDPLQTLQGRVVALAVVLAVVPVVCLNSLVSWLGRDALEAAQGSRLTSISTLERRVLEEWFHKLQAEVSVLAEADYILREVQKLSTETDATTHLRNHFTLQQEGGDEFLELFFMDPQGLIWVSSDPQQEGKIKETRPYFRQGLKGPFVQNIYHSVTLRQPALTITHPVRDATGKVHGVLAARVNLATLNRLTRKYSEPGDSGDSYLVNRYNFFVTEPQAGEGYAFQQAIHTDGVAACLNGQDGVATYSDYRGTAVLGAYTWIAERELCLITEISLAEALAPVRTFNTVALIVLGGVSIGGMMLAVPVARRITQPVLVLATATAELGKGNLAYRVDVPQDNELGRLADAFNRMAGQLQTSARKRDRAEAQLRQKATELEQTLQNLQSTQVELAASEQVALERQQAAQALAAARDEALAATRAKGEFLATMSHEIRTPMNAIIGMTSLLLDTPLSQEQQDFVETLRSSGEGLLTIINDILDFSKIESGHLELEEAPFHLQACIEESLELVTPQAMSKSLELAYQISPQTPTRICGDLTRLRQILVNLLSNAVKFTETGEVVVAVSNMSAVEADPVTLQFSVRDTGIGIPADRLGRLFQPFSQVDSSISRKYGGTGLGLAICKQLAALMGGQIWVESQWHRGTTVHFTIQARRSPELQTRSAPSPLVGKRLLIVDDNATNRRLLVTQTRAWGMQAHAVDSAAAAIACLQTGESFDLAILDVQMPEMDGITLAHRLQQLPAGQTLPLVMLTSVGLPAAAIETAVKPLFSAYLSKPIRHTQLFNILNGLIGDGQRLAVRSPQGPPAIEHDLAARLPLRILVAEDNAVNQKLAIQLLWRMGYRADVAGNGLEVLAALQRQHYDVVLMDVQMPEMDGLTAAQQIHQQWPEQAPYLIAVTANVMRGDRDRCLAAGMDGYLSKPIRLPELVATLRQVPVKAGVLARDQAFVPHANRSTGSPEPPPSDAVDAHAFQELLAAFGGDVEPVSQIVQTYLEDAPSLLAQFDAAARAENIVEGGRVAHTLKSNSAMVGALSLSALCAQIEAESNQQQLLVEALPGLSAALKAAYQPAAIALQRWLNQRVSGL